MGPLTDHPWRRWLLLGFVGAIAGTGIGSLFFVSEFYEYSPFEFPLPNFVIIPTVGMLLYFWTRTVDEVLALSSLTALVCGTVAAIAYLTPLFVQDGMIDTQRHMLTTQAFSRFVGGVSLSAVLLGCGLIVGVILRNEVLGRPADDEVMRRRRRMLVAATGAATLPIPVWGTRVATNYAAALEYRGRRATVTDTQLRGEELDVTVSIPNDLPDEVLVESVLVQVAGGYERESTSSLPEKTIPSESSLELSVAVGSIAAVLDEEPDAIHIDGYVNVSGLTGFEERMRIDPYETTFDE